MIRLLKIFKSGRMINKMDKEVIDLLHRTKLYMEITEELLDESRSGRDLERLINDNAMPKIYSDVVTVLKNEAPELLNKQD